jgi:hypothetical protein
MIMTLEQLILSELQHLELNGIKILKVIIKPNAMQVTFEMSPAIVEFMVNDEYQYQILKVTYNNVVYENTEYLSQFDQIVIDLIKKIKPIEMAKRDEYNKQQVKHVFAPPASQSRLEALEQREQKIDEKEKLLKQKEQEIKAREELLNNKEKLLAMKRAAAIEERNARKANLESTKQVIKEHANSILEHANSIVEYARKAMDGTKSKIASGEDEDRLEAYSEEYGENFKDELD